ncbi:MAG: hypothetical protein KC496_15030 [Anaerolineae bacterium]|nr:hypothetical protein [Anaerolineae bacterium]
MKILQETHNRRIGWYDEEETILLMEVFAPWSWQEAYEAIRFIVDIFEPITTPRYVIYHYIGAGKLVPKDLAFMNIGRLLTVTLEYEGDLVFANASPLTNAFIDLVRKTTRQPSARLRLHYVDSLEVALKLIDKFKQQTLANSDLQE